MEREEYLKIREEQNSLVVKSNELIRNRRHNLSAVQQKIVIYLISKILSEDNDFKTVTINIKTYASIVGIELNGRVYKQLKDDIRALSNKGYWLPSDDEKSEILFRWIDTAKIEKNSGKIEIKLSDSLKPFLLQLRSNFTKYEMYNICFMKSRYSIILYEVLRSYCWMGKWDVSLQELRNILGIENKYSDYRDLKKFVILPAVNEINSKTDLGVKFSTIKIGRKIERINFNINDKQGTQLMLDQFIEEYERDYIRYNL